MQQLCGLIINWSDQQCADSKRQCHCECQTSTTDASSLIVYNMYSNEETLIGNISPKVISCYTYNDVMCKGCDGCCVFCLYCDAWSSRCSCMGSMSVSSCRCCMFVCILWQFSMLHSPHLIKHIRNTRIYYIPTFIEPGSSTLHHVNFITVVLFVWVPDSGAILHKRVNQRKVSSLLNFLWAALQVATQKLKLVISIVCHGCDIL